MQAVFEEIKEQIHALRNMVGPFDLKLSLLDEQISASRTLFEERTHLLETKALATTIRLDKQDTKIAQIEEGYVRLSERMKQIEQAMKVQGSPELPEPAAQPGPVHEDKVTVSILPPQNPV
jgi:chromosome segregation ATPase